MNIFQDAGVSATEKIHESKSKVNAEELECNYCRANLHISWVRLVEDDEENDYCLKHALKYLNDNRMQAVQCKLLYTYTIEEIEKLIRKLKAKVSSEDVETLGNSSVTGESSNQKAKGRPGQKNKSNKY